MFVSNPEILGDERVGLWRQQGSFVGISCLAAAVESGNQAAVVDPQQVVEGQAIERGLGAIDERLEVVAAGSGGRGAKCGPAIAARVTDRSMSARGQANRPLRPDPGTGRREYEHL